MPICGHHKKPMRAKPGAIVLTGGAFLPTTKWVCDENFCEEVRYDRANSRFKPSPPPADGATAGRLLVLEDDVNRHKEFRERYELTVHVVICSTVASALNTVDAAPYTFPYMHLDFDLGDGEFHNGLEFVNKLIKRSVDKYPVQVIVHTSIEPRGKQMVEVLQSVGIQAEYEPYAHHRDGGV